MGWCFLLIGLSWLILFGKIRRLGTIYLGFTLIVLLNFTISLTGLRIVSSFLDGPNYAATVSDDVVLTYSAFGLCAFVIGALLAWRNADACRFKTSNVLVHKKAVYVFFATALLSTLLLWRLPTAPSITSILSTYSSLFKLCLLLAVLSIASGYKRTLIVIGILYFLIGILLMALTGFAGLLGGFLLQPIALLLFMAGFRLRSVALFIGCVVVYVFSASLWLDAREYIRVETQETSALTRVEGLVDRTYDLVETSNFDLYKMHEVISLRLDHTSILAKQVEYMNEMDNFSYGRDLFRTILIASIPRVLWPNKPVKAGGVDNVNEFAGTNYDGARVSVDTSIVFEFYKHFGNIGVVIGLGLFGFAIAFLEKRLLIANLEFRPFLGLALFLLLLVGGGSRLEILIMTSVTILISTLLLVIGLDRFKILRASTIPIKNLQVPSRH